MLMSTVLSPEAGTADFLDEVRNTHNSFNNLNKWIFKHSLLLLFVFYSMDSPPCAFLNAFPLLQHFSEYNTKDQEKKSGFYSTLTRPILKHRSCCGAGEAVVLKWLSSDLEESFSFDGFCKF